jgi:hybrid cluster-associated redox disulfide protein
MNIVALVAAIAALAVAYLALRRVAATEQRLNETQAELARVKADGSETRARLEARLQEVSLEMRRQDGALKFRPDMTIAEAMQLHPSVAGVLARFQLSGCPSCSISDVDTLEGACRSYGIDQAALMGALSQLLEPASSDLLQMARAGRN